MKSNPQTTNNSAITNRWGKQLAIVRIAFGLIWLFDAILKLDPAFYNGILNMVQVADSGFPTWLDGWFNLWFNVIGAGPHFFAISVTILEFLIACALLFGFARRLTYIVGFFFSILLWTVAEGFGGPYVSGSTDLGAGIIYVIAFALLYVTDNGITFKPSYALDTYIAPQLAWWHKLSDR